MHPCTVCGCSADTAGSVCVVEKTEVPEQARILLVLCPEHAFELGICAARLFPIKPPAEQPN